ncbi:hypothetical protein CEXT_385431 [Caerostris extrusa]|uniref:ShKT domain-containing protein n=1 Tax=Caerostris extrusa TaxID=172846 RepID=A0AAV4UAG5_CAEEX|nr:hypothetical protein CEXT_385431 [Caerostris extrusa]
MFHNHLLNLYTSAYPNRPVTAVRCGAKLRDVELSCEMWSSCEAGQRYSALKRDPKNCNPCERFDTLSSLGGSTDRCERHSEKGNRQASRRFIRKHYFTSTLQKW